MKKIISILCVSVIAVTAMAIPARRDGVLRIAEDGSEKMVYRHGDEHFHYLTDGEGQWLDEKTLMPLSETQRRARAEYGKARTQARRAQQETGKTRMLGPRGAVILVSFSDLAFKSTNAEMKEWAMGENYSYNGATGSIHQYFQDISWGQYDLQLDVIGPVTVSKAYSYYGSNDSQGNDEHVDELVKEACKLAADEMDIANYDYDNDGEVDWVVIIYAGYGEADCSDENTIWPHQYKLSYTYSSFKLGGKTIDHYCCLNEIDGQTAKRAGIGTFCHEFSHVMGLPDLYTTDRATHKTSGEWDLMDYGPYNNNGNTPPAYSAYERWWMGWIAPTQMNIAAASVSLPGLNDTKASGYFTTSGKAISNILSPNPTTFYIIENRQKSGWDAYLPGEGMLITKIQYSSDKWIYNEVNNTSSSMGIDIIEADGKAPSYSQFKPNNGYFGKTGDAFPAGSTEYSGITNYAISNVALNNGVITFDVNGGGMNVVLAIDEQETAEKATKRIENGKVVILRGDNKFDILGNRL